jgi:hypothetical protein
MESTDQLLEYEDQIKLYEIPNKTIADNLLIHDSVLIMRKKPFEFLNLRESSD